MSRVVLITGAATGLGAETARLLASEGWRVIVSARKEPAAQKVVEEIKEKGGEATFLHGDVSESEEAVKTLIDNAVAIYGRLDAAFNNAGNSTEAAPFQDQATDKFQEMIQTNILGTFWCMKYELKHFLEVGAGSIVNMASIGGLHGIPFTGSYVATRHAIVGMTRTAAVETAAKGITVNAVAPGAILTEVLQASFDSGLWTEEKVASMFPVKKMGQPIDVARGVSFLLNSPYVTGLILEIEGGFRSRTIVI